MLKIKSYILLASLVFVSAACGIGGKSSVAGVVKTVNGGADWMFINKFEEGVSGSLNGARVSKLKFGPQNSGVVYAATENQGLFKSENSGGTWKNIISKLEVYDLAIDVFDAGIIYAAGIFGDYGKVLKTEDGGASWQEIYNESSNQNAVRAIAINPSNQNELLIGTTSGTLIQSFDGGLSWQLVREFKDRINRILWQESGVFVLLRSQGLYSAGSPFDNFEQLTSELTSKNSLAGGSSGKTRVARFNQVFVDPLGGNLAYLATNVGIFKSVDGGNSWQAVALPVKQGAGEAWSVVVPESSSNLVFTGVNNTIYKSTDGGNSWQTQSIATNGFINYILVDPDLPQIAYAGIYVKQ